MSQEDFEDQAAIQLFAAMVADPSRGEGYRAEGLEARMEMAFQLAAEFAEYRKKLRKISSKIGKAG